MNAEPLSLDTFVGSSNPLQAALDALGTEGGTIEVPNRPWVIPGPCNSAWDVRGLCIRGQGPDSALVFPNGSGGISITLPTPSGTEMQRDQVVLEDLSILTAFPDPAGSGIAVSAQWETAVGDVTNGFTARGCQFMPANHNGIGHWNAGIKLVNARNNLIERCAFAGGSLRHEGTGVMLTGGTVATVITGNCQFTDLGTGLVAVDVCEGIKVIGCDFVDCHYAAWLDGSSGGDHKISEIAFIGVHASCVRGGIYAQQTAFLRVADVQFQKREGTGDDYCDILFARDTTVSHVHDSTFLQRGTGGGTLGVVITPNNNSWVNVHDNWFGNRDVAIEGYCYANNNTPIGDVGQMWGAA